MKDKTRMEEIIRRLEKKFASNNDDHWVNEPFHTLIATILSQNTSDLNSHRAFLKLLEHFDVKPEVLADLKPEDIKPVIVSAGLSNIKSHRLIEVSKEVLKRLGGDLNNIFKFPLDDAREALMSIKGIGPKTADVVLSFVGGYPVMPIDTNIFRIVERIGFSKGRNYERTRRALELLIPTEKLKEAHLHLIRLGREICKPKKPMCPICPINSLCNYGLNALNVDLEE
jgi:endonuclease-3